MFSAHCLAVDSGSACFKFFDSLIIGSWGGGRAPGCLLRTSRSPSSPPPTWMMVVVMVVVRMRMRMRILNPPATLVGKLEHVFVNVPVLLHNLGVLLGHHVDHNTARLAEAGHRGEAEGKESQSQFSTEPTNPPGKRDVSSSEAAHHDDAVEGAP